MAKLKHPGGFNCSKCSDLTNQLKVERLLIVDLIKAGDGLIESVRHLTTCDYMFGRTCNCDVVGRMGQARKAWVDTLMRKKE